MEDPLGRLPKKRSSSISDPPRFASPAVAALAGTGRGSGFKPRCEQCKRPVLSDQVEAQGRVYHEEHFRCKRCKVPLAGAKYVFFRDRPFCEACHAIKLTDRCAHCNEPILQDKIVALGKFWHADHFFCCVCRQPFTQETPFCEREGKAYCERDFNEAFLPKCAKCNQAIVDGSCISAIGKKWHPNHFTCTVCGVPIDVGSPVYVHDGQPYCAKDFPEGDGEDLNNEEIITPTAAAASRIKRTRSFNRGGQKLGRDKDRERSTTTPNFSQQRVAVKLKRTSEKSTKVVEKEPESKDGKGKSPLRQSRLTFDTSEVGKSPSDESAEQDARDKSGKRKPSVKLPAKREVDQSADAGFPTVEAVDTSDVEKDSLLHKSPPQSARRSLTESSRSTLSKKMSREFTTLTSRLPKALSGRKLKDRLIAKSTSARVGVSVDSIPVVSDLSTDEEILGDEDPAPGWENIKELSKRPWPKRVLPADAEPDVELVADIPGFNRELGGEQDTTDLGYTWTLPQNIPYYKCYFHDPPEVELEHYAVIDDLDRPMIISIEVKFKRRINQITRRREHVYRAIIRTISGDERLLIYSTVDTKKGRLQALKQAYPQLQEAKVIEIKDKKYGEVPDTTDCPSPGTPTEQESPHPRSGTYSSLAFSSGEDLRLSRGPNMWIGRSLSENLVIYEAKMSTRGFKFGVLYARNGQYDENDMYNNKSGSPAFEEFLSLLGTKIELKGWNRYRAGLNVTTNLTGTHSIYTEHHGWEVMFHVSTYIPFTEDDKQQVERKRHLGNDVVLVVFRDGGKIPFSPEHIASQFNHVFCVVQPEGDRYRVSFSFKQGVHPNLPYLPHPPLFEKDERFHDFLLTKLISAEVKAMNAQQFSVPFRRTRRELLRDLIRKYTNS